MNYVLKIVMCLTIATAPNIFAQNKKFDVEMTSELGAVKAQMSLAYNQKHWSITDNNITLVCQIDHETDESAEIQFMIYKNPDNCKDEAKLIENPKFTVMFGQQAKLTVGETHKNIKTVDFALAFTLSKE